MRMVLILSLLCSMNLFSASNPRTYTQKQPEKSDQKSQHGRQPLDIRDGARNAENISPGRI